ncbi:hypothetical protein ACFL6E_07300 [Candidatus Neomarinimicrobiota bacterium]
MALIYSCDLNPLQSQIPGSQWVLEPVVAGLDTVFTYSRATAFGSSSSLYAGTRGDIEAGSLIRFEMPDSLTVANTLSAELYIFPKDTNLVTGNFYLDLVQDLETPWAEGDTGLTLSKFAGSVPIDTSRIVDSTVGYFISTTVRDSADIAHVKFSINPLILQNWKSANVANNGFLVTTDDNLSLFSFYSSYSIKNPYLLIEYTLSDTDTTVYRGFLKPTHDTYVINNNSSASNDGLQLSFVQGKRVHIDFSNQFIPEIERPVAGGRLTLFKDEISEINGANVTLYVLSRIREYSALDDTSFTVIRSVSMPATADSLVISISGFLQDVLTGGKDNFGIDLLVNPLYNDFDQLVFHDSLATVGLRPRLEILYATPYATEEGND